MLKTIGLKNALLFVAVCLFSLVPASAQVSDAGSFNTWAKTQFARKHNDSGALVGVRAAKNDGYDRVVFDFKDNKIPSYQIQFAEPPFYYGESDEAVKVTGKKFVKVSLISTTAHDIETGKSILTYKKGKLGFPSVQETAFIYDFEGTVEFVIGLSDGKDFRVLELKEPARLVIDFKQ